MARENKDKTPEGRDYIYKRCLPCKIKLHVDTYTCPKCGRRTDNMTYGSKDPSDALYGARLNSVKKCMACSKAQEGRICKYTICFGTGRGKCDLCERLEFTRFYCCQEMQKSGVMWIESRKEQVE